jgi:hypothetical protein
MPLDHLWGQIICPIRNSNRIVQVRISGLAGRNKFADLILAPIEVLGRNCPAKQLIDEPYAVCVQHVAFATVSNLCKARQSTTKSRPSLATVGSCRLCTVVSKQA